MYLSKIAIANYKGIEHLEVDFSPKINIIVGENGRSKSALIDAIRLLYNLGEPVRDITVSRDDFHEKIIIGTDDQYSVLKSDLIKIVYEFRDLSPEQKGAFFEYMVVGKNNEDNDFARIEIQYKDDKKYPYFSYSTGNIEGQKADVNTFRLFQHYYLGALRDSTKDLLNVRGNILGKVIKRLIERKKSEEDIKSIIKEANDKLLERNEVKDTRENINSNLDRIFKKIDNSQINLHIEQSKIDYIVNVIKPFLPHSLLGKTNEGFQLWQNSLGFNNLIYIATVLSDIKERIIDDQVSHFSLLIEEPEAHIHPQLQLSLYNFLKEANELKNSQLFITSHSPTLTSKVPFENLILLDKRAYCISNSFTEREAEEIIQDTVKNKKLTNADIQYKKKQLERYVDVTKSQMFFARSCLFVEGISEELLISAFCKIEEFDLEDYRIEVVNVDGVSFYPFLFLFNSVDKIKKIPKNIAILTDDDRFSESGKIEYNIENLVVEDYKLLNHLNDKIKNGIPSNRVKNLSSVANKQNNISLKTAYQTFEYDVCLCNIEKIKADIPENFLFKFLEQIQPDKLALVKTYVEALPNDNITEEQKEKIAILLWKSMQSKADFAQDFALQIIDNLSEAKKKFIVPTYIKNALEHLKGSYAD